MAQPIYKLKAHLTNMDKTTKGVILSAILTVTVSLAGAMFSANTQQIINTVDLTELAVEVSAEAEDISKLQALTTQHSYEILSNRQAITRQGEVNKVISDAINSLRVTVERNITQGAVVSNTVDRLIDATNTLSAATNSLEGPVIRLDTRVDQLEEVKD